MHIILQRNESKEITPPHKKKKHKENPQKIE